MTVVSPCSKQYVLRLFASLFNCAGFDDRAVVFAVVIPAKPQHDIPRAKWECLHLKLLARYFNNVDCHLCLRRWDLHKQEQSAGEKQPSFHGPLHRLADLASKLSSLIDVKKSKVGFV